jgi:hypothetical protein
MITIKGIVVPFAKIVSIMVFDFRSLTVAVYN